MIDVQIAILPSVTADQTDRLPKCSGCYFVLDGEAVLYIGQSGNIRRRWTHHHRRHEVRSVSGVKIAWLETKSRREAARIEPVLIARFKPVWNGQRVLAGLPEPTPLSKVPYGPTISPKDRRLLMMLQDCDRAIDFFSRKIIPQTSAERIRLWRTISIMRTSESSERLVREPNGELHPVNLLYEAAVNGQGIYASDFK